MRISQYIIVLTGFFMGVLVTPRTMASHNSMLLDVLRGVNLVHACVSAWRALVVHETSCRLLGALGADMGRLSPGRVLNPCVLCFLTGHHPPEDWAVPWVRTKLVVTGISTNSETLSSRRSCHVLVAQRGCHTLH